MNEIFWIIMVVIDVIFLIFALARVGSLNQSIEDRIETERAISNLTTAFVGPLFAIACLISTITTLIAIWG